TMIECARRHRSMSGALPLKRIVHYRVPFVRKFTLAASARRSGALVYMKCAGETRDLMLLLSAAVMEHVFSLTRFGYWVLFLLINTTSGSISFVSANASLLHPSSFWRL
ncbi:hypothetical protein HAX54_006707, partial [Datura stramonium]|nr:hypothetical protein [Datura stramonium]